MFSIKGVLKILLLKYNIYVLLFVVCIHVVCMCVFVCACAMQQGRVNVPQCMYGGQRTTCRIGSLLLQGRSQR